MLDGLNTHNQSFIHFFSIFSSSFFLLKSSGKSFCFTNSNFSNWNSISYLKMLLLNHTIRSCQVAFLFKSSSTCVAFSFYYSVYSRFHFVLYLKLYMHPWQLQPSNQHSRTVLLQLDSSIVSVNSTCVPSLIQDC